MMMNMRGLVFDDPHHTVRLTMTNIEFSHSVFGAEDGDNEMTEVSR